MEATVNKRCPLVTHDPRRAFSRAEDLIQQTGLRTLDALHVASALTFKAASGIHLAFVTGDRQQRDAAKESGLDVIGVH
jgi:predicted nucleic acid-binding protein